MRLNPRNVSESRLFTVINTDFFSIMVRTDQRVYPAYLIIILNIYTHGSACIPSPAAASVFYSLSPSVLTVRPVSQWPGSEPSASAGLPCEREDYQGLEVLLDQPATGSTWKQHLKQVTFIYVSYLLNNGWSCWIVHRPTSQPCPQSPLSYSHMHCKKIGEAGDEATYM